MRDGDGYSQGHGRRAARASRPPAVHRGGLPQHRGARGPRRGCRGDAVAAPDPQSPADAADGTDAFAEAGPAPARAAWDEEKGWSLSVRRQSVDYQVSKGLDLVPDPDDVAAWVVVALTHPELTPSYENGPRRAHGVADPDFEARLARYPATS